ncbi:MAG: hypothetical protein C5B57_11800 [Blastocatellia bacterium]|nr:MAG: hypothetical protein C5B57_11800 [Blastocatellia bacterium]
MGENLMAMTCTLLLILLVSSSAGAQDAVNVTTTFTQGPGLAQIDGKGTPVLSAPYAATVTNESVQILADGTRIVHTSTGTTARDSQGRIRQETALPNIGNLSAANSPQLAFIQDPVGQVSYTLNLTAHTAQKMPAPLGGVGVAAGVNTFFFQRVTPPSTAGPLPLPPLLPIAASKALVTNEQGLVVTENLGSQVMEGLVVQGVRTTRTIPPGQIGNDRPIKIVTEIWTSPDLQTIVSSKRSDPRIGEQTFELTHINRGEPDPSLFTVPADFRITDGPQKFIYRVNQ